MSEKISENTVSGSSMALSEEEKWSREETQGLCADSPA